MKNQETKNEVQLSQKNIRKGKKILRSVNKKLKSSQVDFNDLVEHFFDSVNSETEDSIVQKFKSKKEILSEKINKIAIEMGAKSQDEVIEKLISSFESRVGNGSL